MRCRRLHLALEGRLVANNWAFVGAAFALTWAVILGYLGHLLRTMRRARQQLEAATRVAGGAR
jgi:hypothetical protein